MEWTPFKTAPKTGERFLAKCEDGWIAIYYWALELEEPEFLGDDFRPPERVIVGWRALTD